MSLRALRRGTMAGRGAAPAFTPASIAGLRVWLDATQMGLNDGDAVGTWSDLSGGGRHATQATGGNKPTFKTSIINGNAVVRFNGTTNYLTFASGIMTPAQPGTVFIILKLVADPPTLSTQYGLWTLGTSTSNYHPYSDGVIYDSFGSDTRKTTVNPTPSLTSPHIYGVVAASGDWRSYLDGTLLFSTASNTVAWSTAPALGRSLANDLLCGDLGEFVLYEAALGTTDRQTVEAYLKTKWGII